jgi:hypothetical protein
MTIEMNLSIEYSDEYLPDTEKIDVRKKLRFVSNFHIRSYYVNIDPMNMKISTLNNMILIMQMK